MPINVLKKKWKVQLVGSLLVALAFGYLGGVVSQDYLLGKLSIKALVIAFLAIWVAFIAEDKIAVLK